MQQNRSSILLLLAIIISLCLFIGAVGVWMWTFSSNRQTAAATATIPPATGTSASPPAATGTPGSPASATAAPPDEVAIAMDAIQEQVVQIRGLQPGGEFTRTIFSPEQLRERVVNDFFADYTPEEAAEDALVLATLGLLEPGYDLIGLYTELFSEQVAGFYDNETKEMVVVGSAAFGGPEKLTYAHEYAHALQDQNFDIRNGLQYNDDACELDSERCAAVQALIEGDASLLELQWFFDYSSADDQEQIFEYYTGLESPVFEAAPAFLQEDFIFPYNQGYLFVEAIYNAGGWAAVDAAYANLPVSTEQILHPEKYPSDVPVPVSLPDLLPVLGEGWELLEDNVMGEWYIYLILAFGSDPSARLDQDQAAAAAAGWGGDRYAVYIQRTTGQLAFVMQSVWDTGADLAEFSSAFRSYADRRFGGGSALGEATLWSDGATAHLFAEADGTTIWIAAPDAQTAEALLAEIR